MTQRPGHLIVPGSTLAEPPGTTGTSLGERWAHWVVTQPDAVAIEDGDAVLSLAELDSRASRLGRWLAERGVRPDVRVGLCLERSTDMACAMVAVMKAGGAYVPLDPGHPVARVGWTATDADVSTIVTQARHLNVLADVKVPTLCLDRDASAWRGVPPLGAAYQRDPSNLAYVIYTSGSTGRPKGIAVTDLAVDQLTQAQDYVTLGPGDRVAHASTTTFDAATFEIWGALLNGATVHIVPRDDLSVAGLTRHLQGPGAPSTIFITTPLFNRLANQTPDIFRELRDVLFGGEAADPHSVRRVLEAGPPRRLVHVYGPTETTTFATWWLSQPEVVRDATAVPIGRPLKNMRAYVVDSRGDLVGADGTGELHLGGPQLSRGYIRQPALTAQRFVPDAYSGVPGERLYRTGDRVRQRADGAFEFLNRTDDQVKVRGFRVEPAEIELAIRSHPGVREAIVVTRVRSEGDRELVAFVVATAGTAVEELRATLADRLPAYMLPAHILLIDEMPLGATGKIDRDLLARAAFTLRPATSEEASAENGTETEQAVASIWGEVLAIGAVGGDADFFMLGGDSLHAISMAARIRERFQVELPMSTIFQNPMLPALAAAIDGARRTRGGEVSRIPVVARDGRLPPSFAQERVLLMQALDESRLAYNFQSTLRFEGALDVDALERALRAVVSRHEVYRTVFLSDASGTYCQIADDITPFPFAVVDLTDLPESARGAALRQLIASEIASPFRLNELPLARWVLYRLAARNHVLLHIEHHIVHDGWSFTLFPMELAETYRAIVQGKPVQLPALPIQFADFARWEREWIDGAEARAQVDYWRAQLAGAPDALDLPYDRDRPAKLRFVGQSLRLRIPAETYAAVRRLAREEGVSDFAVFLTAFFTLFHLHGRNTDICLGLGVAIRRYPEIRDLMGMLINNIVLRASVRPGQTLRELMRTIWRVAREGYAHQDVPWNEVVRAIAPVRRGSRNPFFNVMVGIHDAPLTAVTIPDLTIELYEGINNGSSKFDLGITIVPPLKGGGSLTREADPDGAINWEYSSDLFDRSTVARMASSWSTILERIVSRPDSSVADSGEPVPSAGSTNSKAVTETSARLVVGLVEAQVARTPDAICARFDDCHLSYGELDARADRLARVLRAHGVQAERPVGVLLERSLELAVSLLAIWKAGGAYLPLDGEHPPERLAAIVADAAPAAMIAREASIPWLRDVAIVPPDGGAWPEATGVCSHDGGTAPRPGPQHAAYVMYTSGSTGKPKGVVVTLAALTNTLLAVLEAWRIESTDVMAAIASSTVDFSLVEIVAPWLAGAATRIVRRSEVLDPPRLIRRLADVTLLHVVPGLLQQLLRGMKTGGTPPGLRLVSTGGDLISAELLRATRRTCPDAVVDVNYGPTEAAIICADERFAREPVERDGAVGQPIANMRLHVLDDGLEPVSTSALGELYVAGAGVARGYIGRRGLTAERFVADRFGPPGARMYRTGDLVRRHGDGSFEFVGRADDQVKVRGFRVEPGEIETALRTLTGVKDAVVVATGPEGERRLVAYWVPGEFAPPDTAALHARLARCLPSFMLPAAIVQLPVLPLTERGKVDREALASRPLEWSEEMLGDTPPRTDLERDMAAIWQGVLGVSTIGVRDNFFTLGGHSLMATSVMVRVRDHFGIDLPTNQLFDAPTIEEFAAIIERRMLAADSH